MSIGKSKAERLREMEWLYLQRPYMDSELAERFGVDKSTIYRDRMLLTTEIPLIETEHGRWKIDRTSYISNVRLNLHESLALYLTARNASRQTLFSQPHLAQALEKLAGALRQPMMERIVKAANAVMSQENQPERIRILEIVTQAWVESRKVKIIYQSLSNRRPSHHTVQPYLIEPSLTGDGAYLIGWSDVHADLTTFKIERIEKAEITFERFEIPDDFNEQDLLKYAWGIWFTDGEPVSVRLRFAPGIATQRLRESIWQPNQRITVSEDGGCIWEAEVAEWKEMLPWVRGWGADCEVLEPLELREAVKEEVERLGRIYRDK